MRGFVSVGTGPDGWRRQRALSEPDVWQAFGLHPWWVDAGWETAVAALDLSGAVAVGEIGLDRKRPGFDLQERAYRAQLELARQHRLPVVLHVVKAFDALGAELDGLQGVLHSYSGSREQLKTHLKRGFYVSFSTGCLRGGDKVEKSIRAVPGDRLLVETDSPDQDPDGGRNEPSKVVRVVEFVARVRGEDPAELGRVTGENARRLFGL